MKYTTPSKKEDILTSIIALWKDAEKDFLADQNNLFNRGRYTAALDLLKMVKIYEKACD